MTITTFAAALEPFLILRLVQHIRPTPRWTEWSAALGFVVVWLMLLLFPPPRPAWAIFASVLYSATVNSYAGVQMIRTTRHARGITAWRALLVAVGVILFSGVIVIEGVSLTLQLEPFEVGLMLMGFGLLFMMALAFYLGFAPPRFLYQWWQRLELFDFLRALANRSDTERAVSASKAVTQTAARCVGAQRAFIVTFAGATQSFVTDPTEPLEAFVEPAQLRGGILERVWQTKTAALAMTPGEMGAEIARVADTWRTKALAVIPILPTHAPKRLLLVWLRHVPLFVRDDFAFLELLARETATALDVAELYAEHEYQEEKFRHLLDSAPEPM
ncbi:MAG: hypothetical protein L0Y55_00725, partial [Anaerolineales bacterium]|nr:hypothetical protein [Anaerolineales bacterium]